jgi:hypothetical protein
MTYRIGIERRIEKEQNRIHELQVEIEHVQSFIEGLQEALKMLPKEKNLTTTTKGGKREIRSGSDMAKVRDLIKQVGRPMSVGEIVTGLGKPDTKENRASLSGSLGRYVRKGEIFSRPKANTFSLIGIISEISNKLPPDFGIEETPDDDIPF